LDKFYKSEDKSMKDFLNYIYRHSNHIYKSLIFGSALLLILFLFSKNGQFQYEYTLNKSWQYHDMTAPFDFTIKKSAKTVKKERDSIKAHIPLVFKKKNLNLAALSVKTDSLIRHLDLDPISTSYLIKLNHQILPAIYQTGFIPAFPKNYTLPKVFIIEGKILKSVPVSAVYQTQNIRRLLKKYLPNRSDLVTDLTTIYLSNLPTNLKIDQKDYQELLKQKLDNISLNKGFVSQGQTIIKKGEIVTPQKYEMLNSLKLASGFYAGDWSQKLGFYLGDGILVAMVLLMLSLFLKKYRPEIYENNIKISLIIFNMLLMLVLTTLIVKYYPAYVYIVPLAILPLILKAFFDARVGLFVHILTVLLLGFVVTNSFEFIFLQIMAGIVSVLTVSELTKRSNLFTSVGNIILVYMVGYLAFHLIFEGNFSVINYNVLLQFLLNGLLAIALAHQLILLYEKLFGLVSDVSLLEWSNTNSKLLRRLADKAPGTFNHSMQVANLAEAAANEIGANSLLIRAGALYHDIGKMLNPFYFTENQTSDVNYHDDLPPEDSARIIIQHVLDGVELARKNNLPDRIIDFIRTHHGTGLVQYFYKKALEENPAVDKEKFRYPGPNPFSKETAVLMMADSVEAASKSLREPTAEKIDDFVDKIIDHQLHSGLLDNANITLKEISTIKKLFKKKLKNIYHLRIEYPE